MGDSMENILINYGSVIAAIMAAFIIFMLTRKKTPRDFSFKVRTSLATVIGYASLLHDGKLGRMTVEQKNHLTEILTSAEIVAAEIARIESSNLSNPDTEMSFNIRTALMGMRGYCDVLAKQELSAQQKECLNQIQTAANSIFQLLKV